MVLVLHGCNILSDTINDPLTDQLLYDRAVRAGSVLQEAPLALRDHPPETASAAQTGENPTRQTRC